MWEAIKNALSSVKETAGIEIPGVPADLGSVGESATTAVQGLTESATGAIDGVSEGAGDIAATAVESAGEARPNFFDELFGANPLK